MNDETQVEQPTTNAVATRPTHLPVQDDGEFAQLLDTNRFAQVQRVAKLFAESDLVPEVFQGKTANCAVALQMAFRMRVDPMMLMQNMYIVHGKPGIEAKLAIALINSRGPFDGPIQWRVAGEGENRSWTAFAKHKKTGETCEATVSWAMVKAEGWDKNSKWKSLPDLMGRYRSATFLGRLYCPEVLLGLPTDDELADVSGMRSVEGEVVDMMPRARAQPAEAVGNGSGEKLPPFEASVERTAPAIEGEHVDTETGEVHKPKANGNGKAADEKHLNTPASDAQRRMIRDIAKRGGITPEALDVALADRFAVTLEALPIGYVNDCIQFVRDLKPAAA